MGKAECISASLLQDAKNFGATPDDTKNFKILADLHDKMKMAGASLRNDKLLATDVLLTQDSLSNRLLEGFQEFTNIPARDILLFTMKPQEIMGVDVTDAVREVYRSFKASTKNPNMAQWRKKTTKVWDSMEKLVLENSEDFKKHYIKKYFKELKEGSVEFGSETNESPFTKVVRNVVGNFVGNNPLITAYNLVEISPKGLMYALGNGGDVGTFIRALKQTYQQSGGQVWRRIPEFEQLGVYGKRDFAENNKLTKTLKLEGVVDAVKGIQEKTGVDNILDPTENFMRSIYYNMGRELYGAGNAFKALEDLSFVYEFGNIPEMLWRTSDKNALALMRFSVGMLSLFGKMSYGLLNAVKNKDLASASKYGQAFLAFGVVQAIQTGVSSVIPWPVAVLPDEVREKIGLSDEQLSSYDEGLPLNLVNKLTGARFEEGVRPFGLPALGVGLALAQQDVNAFKRNFNLAVESASEGELLQGAMATATAGAYFFQLGRIPGLNFTTARLMQTATEASVGEVEWDEAHMDALIRLKLYSDE
jgi:hypothetical protein